MPLDLNNFFIYQLLDVSSSCFSRNIGQHLIITIRYFPFVFGKQNCFHLPAIQSKSLKIFFMIDILFKLYPKVRSLNKITRFGQTLTINKLLEAHEVTKSFTSAFSMQKDQKLNYLRNCLVQNKP